jgi:hypothetical protein
MNVSSQPDPKATEATRKRYQRIAPFYDLMEVLPEQHYQSWRQHLWSLVEGPEVLEVSCGTHHGTQHKPAHGRNRAPAGLIVERIEDLGLGDIFKLIVAHRDGH